MFFSLPAGLRRPRTSAFRCILFAAVAWTAAPLIGQTKGTITAQFVSITPHLRAYAQVVPISTLPLNAEETGILFGLKVTPGMHVRAGQVLATLRGPEIQSLILQQEASLRSARIQLRNAQKTLTIQQEQLRAHLSTREGVHQAMSAVASAEATLQTSQSRLLAAKQMAQVTAPTNALVLALHAATGERVSAGQPIITLQPAHALWLRASYYGSHTAQIHTGMTGTFTPTGSGKPIPVQVRAIAGVIGTSGSESVMMTAAKAATPWQNGQFGTVTLNLPATRMIAIPTRALILNQGNWWVMVHTPHGGHPQMVVPGPAQGWNTCIVSGLVPGTQVIVKNAYLLFQAKAADQYQIPD
jgi:RND family efflux transporter MFP subunit